MYAQWHLAVWDRHHSANLAGTSFDPSSIETWFSLTWPSRAAFASGQGGAQLRVLCPLSCLARRLRNWQLLHAWVDPVHLDHALCLFRGRRARASDRTTRTTAGGGYTNSARVEMWSRRTPDAATRAARGSYRHMTVVLPRGAPEPSSGSPRRPVPLEPWAGMVRVCVHDTGRRVGGGREDHQKKVEQVFMTLALGVPVHGSIQSCGGRETTEEEGLRRYSWRCVLGRRRVQRRRSSVSVSKSRASQKLPLQCVRLRVL